MQTEHQGEDITGILLVYPSFVVHFLESSEEMIYGLIRDLKKMSKNSSGMLVDPKILIISHDVPTRFDSNEREFTVVLKMPQVLRTILKPAPVPPVPAVLN